MMLRSPNLYNISAGDEVNYSRSGLHDNEYNLGTFVHAYISIHLAKLIATRRTESCELWKQHAKERINPNL